jgi:hypothetical protein
MATTGKITQLLNDYEVAEALAVSVATVRRWRLLRQGPMYIKIGAAVRYKPEDLTAWLGTRPVGGSEPSLRSGVGAERVSEVATASSRGGGNRPCRDA